MFTLILLLGLFVLKGLAGLSTNAHYSAYFAKDDPLLKQWQSLQQDYQLRDKLVVLIRDPLALHSRRVTDYHRFEQALQNLPYLSYSQSYFQALLPDLVEGELEGIQAIIDLYPDEKARLTQIQENPVTSLLFNAQSSSGLLILALELPLEDSVTEIQHFMQAVDKVMGKHLNEWESVSYFYSGTMALNASYIQVVRHDLKLFIPGLFLLFTLGLYCLLRSLIITAALLANGVLSVLLAYGTLGHFSVELTAINAFTPVIILTLAVAANLHLLFAYARQTKQQDVLEALKLSYKQTTQPYLLSMLTTAAGFCLLILSPSPPVRLVGLAIAIALLFSVVLSLLLMPALLKNWSPAKKLVDKLNGLEQLQTRATLILSNAKIVNVLGVGLFTLSLLVVTQLKIDDKVYDYFPEQQAFSQGLRALQQDFAAVSEMHFALGVQQGTILTAGYMQLLGELRLWLEQAIPEAKLLDIAHVIQQNKLNLQQVEQQLSQGFAMGGIAKHWLLQDLSASRFVLQLPAKTSGELIAIEQQVSDWFARQNNQGNFVLTRGSSADLVFAHLGQRNASNMLWSLLLALVVISLLTGILFRSLKILCIATLVNLLPILMVYAFWTLTGGYISLGCALVMGMVMGLIVDDTLHLLYAAKASNYELKRLLPAWFKVMPAIVASSLMILLGMSLGLLSDFTPIRELSLLTLLAVFFALFADLVLLPTLIKGLVTSPKQVEMDKGRLYES